MDFYSIYFLSIKISIVVIKCNEVIWIAKATDYYPVEYGSYQTQYFNETIPYSLKFCNINSVKLLNLDVFSNGDLIAELSVDNMNFIESAATNTSTILVRIDYNTGAIVWWKSYFFSGYNFQFTSLSLKVENDMVWTINTSLDPNFSN